MERLSSNDEAGMTEDGKTVWPALGEYIEVYESALAFKGEAELAEFAPPANHPERLAILCELVRVDLEYQWEQGRQPHLEHYRDRFPALFEEPELVREMAYEEYRQRQRAGEAPASADYRRRFGVETDSWPPAPSGSGRAAESSRPGAAPLPHSIGEGTSDLERAASAYRHFRKEGGGLDDLASLLKSYQVPAEHAEFLRELDQSDPHAAERLADAFAGLPRVGDQFLGFRLCGELGRGAFGRVFLARQGDLAHRLVALKVSADVAGESHALAQLQHTNVVPVYSVHRNGPHQAVCMPFLGAATLADTVAVLKVRDTMPDSGEALLATLTARARSAARAAAEDGTRARTDADEDMSRSDEPPRTDSQVQVPPEPPRSAPQVIRLRELGFVPAVLWLIARVADGLAHAHERGILHRDLKPANILFADDGEPLLLDFNLAADMKARARVSAALVGGTLPYMAPEHLAAFRDDLVTFDARCDVYSLGVVLFELLTGAHPFPVRRGRVSDALPAMIADRQVPAPDVRGLNPAASPAVASIVRRCLEADPARRYQSARQLQEDLERQLDHLPLLHAADSSPRERLTKWAIRHPRATSSTTVAVIAAALIIAITAAAFVGRQHSRRVEAAESFRRLAEERREAIALLSTPDVDPALIEEGLGYCGRIVQRYGVLEGTYWEKNPLAANLAPTERRRLREDLGDLLVLGSAAYSSRAASGVGHTKSDDLAAAATWLDRATESFGAGNTPRALALARADLARAAGRPADEVRSLRETADAIPPRGPAERLLLATERIDSDRRSQILADLDAVTEEDPRNFVTWIARGNWFARLGMNADAVESYGVGIAMAPRRFWPYLHRGLLFLDLRNFSRAVADFDRLIALRPDWAAAYLNRAIAKLELGDPAGAVADLNLCLARDDAPARAWFVRARAKARLGDEKGAHLDQEEGMKQQPRDPDSFVTRGVARLPHDPQSALADFEAALALNPRHLMALQDKASVLSENLGRTEHAIRVLDSALEHFPASVPALAGRAVLHARLGHRDAALRDAREALTLDDKAITLYQAACVFAQTLKQKPADSHEAIRLLASAFRKDHTWVAVAATDPDLAPIRDRPEFTKLVNAYAVVEQAEATQ
jgi:eukaryotic-like serine/threonine-protein kinase